jgi:hypothetical protein
MICENCDGAISCFHLDAATIPKQNMLKIDQNQKITNFEIFKYTHAA